jgi:hypothetical protein
VENKNGSIRRVKSLGLVRRCSLHQQMSRYHVKVAAEAYAAGMLAHASNRNT